MSSQSPERSAAAPLPPGQLAIESYWLLRRHAGVYAAQVAALAGVCWVVELAVTIVVDVGTVHAGPGFRAVAAHLSYIGALVTILVLGGTAMFVSCQRAIVLDQVPAVGHALKLRQSDLGMLRAVWFYWLVVHLVPTVVVNGARITEAIGLPLLYLPTAVGFAFYWGWVLATAPLVVLSLPITLFEASRDPVAEGRRRLDGNTGRLVVASALAFAPIAALDVALYAFRTGYDGADDGTLLLLDGLIMPILQSASSLATILVMSTLVAATYLRLSPRL